MLEFERATVKFFKLLRGVLPKKLDWKSEILTKIGIVSCVKRNNFLFSIYFEKKCLSFGSKDAIFLFAYFYRGLFTESPKYSG